MACSKNDVIVRCAKKLTADGQVAFFADSSAHFTILEAAANYFFPLLNKSENHLNLLRESIMTLDASQLRSCSPEAK